MSKRLKCMGPIHTISARRERFSHAIESVMSAVGWERVQQMTYVYRRSTPCRNQLSGLG